jgi:hypothetical protein
MLRCGIYAEYKEFRTIPFCNYSSISALQPALLGGSALFFA